MLVRFGAVLLIFAVAHASAQQPQCDLFVGAPVRVINTSSCVEGQNPLHVRSCGSLVCDPPCARVCNGWTGTIRTGPSPYDGFVWWSIDWDQPLQSPGTCANNFGYSVEFFDGDCVLEVISGACCLDEDTCFSLAQETCLANGGDYYGDDVPCSSTDCDGSNPCATGSGDCCSGCPHGTGCNNTTCCNTVCAYDSFCCDTEWDCQCQDIAEEQCPSLCGGPPDTTPPSVPTGLTATAVSPFLIELEWNPSSDAQSGVDHYSVYRDRDWIGDSGDEDYSDDTVSPSTSYCYEVSATNGAGYESSLSEELCTTTTSESSLTVSPAIDFVSTGGEGGRFTPSSRSFVVTNTSDGNVLWSAQVENGPWLTVEPGAGFLATGQTVDVVVALNNDALFLEAGSYAARVHFRDVTHSSEVAVRDASLDVTSNGAPLSIAQTVILDFQHEAPFQMIGVDPWYSGCRPVRSEGSTPHLTSNDLSTALQSADKTLADFVEDVRSRVSRAYFGFGIEFVLTAADASSPPSRRSRVFFANSNATTDCATAGAKAVDFCNLDGTDDALVFVLIGDYINTSNDAVVATVHEVGHLLGLSHTTPQVGQWMYTDVFESKSSFVGEALRWDIVPGLGHAFYENDRFRLKQALGAADWVEVGSPGSADLLLLPSCTANFVVDLLLEGPNVATAIELNAVVWHGSDVARVVPLSVISSGSKEQLRVSVQVGSSESLSVEGYTANAENPEAFLYFGKAIGGTLNDLDPSLASFTPASGISELAATLINVTGGDFQPLSSIVLSSSKIGDLDRDGDIDRFDAAAVASNMTSPRAEAIGVGAGSSDLDFDNDVDLYDFVVLLRSISPCMVGCAVPGACCFGDGECLILSDAICLGNGGEFGGEGVDCAWDLCVGACCYEYGCEWWQTPFNCANENGSYQGNGTDCEDQTIECPYPPRGACCDGLDCGYAEPEYCAEVGGAFLGVGTDCDDWCCTDPPTRQGACCFSSGGCFHGCEESCNVAGGVYQGEGTTCTEGICGDGACCYPDGECDEIVATLCESNGGEFMGAGIECSGQCSAACCILDNACLNVPPTWCTDYYGGDPQPMGTSCSDPTIDCPNPTGACCFPGNPYTILGCSNLTEFECSAYFGFRGVYYGDGSTCSEVSCLDGYCPGDGGCCDLHRSVGCADAACCETVCSVDPLCCVWELQGFWDEICVQEANELCGAGDGTYCLPCPGEGDCCLEHRGAGCSDAACCQSVCRVDRYCCEVTWDEVCAERAVQECTCP